MIPNPRNETTMHYILKCLGFIILRGLNCKFVSTECLLRQTHDEQGINVNYNGRKVIRVGMLLEPECPCCRAKLWHCEECWNKYHNGLRDNDWIPPKFHGQRLGENIYSFGNKEFVT